MNNKFLNAVKERRSHYVLKNESPISNDKIISLIEDAVLYTPSAFNSQSSRVVILFSQEHEALWDLITETLRKLVPSEKFQSTLDKMKMFKASYGTILFYEDQSVVKGLQEKYPLYKDNFPVWSEQSAGMLNFVVWTLLSENGLGASLQHYNPIIDAEVAKRFNVSKDWKLIAQMPFGTSITKANEKQFVSADMRVKVFGK